jgi:hypothetical protein
MEMFDPKWFDIDALPLEEMMPADSVWLPVVLSGRKIIGSAKYSPCQKELLSSVIYCEVEELPD